jgi:hypothetical protein
VTRFPTGTVASMEANSKGSFSAKNRPHSTNVVVVTRDVENMSAAVGIGTTGAKAAKGVTAMGKNAKTIKKKRSTNKKSRVTKSVLASVVRGAKGGKRLNGLQISKNLGVSRSTGYRIRRAAEKFPSSVTAPVQLVRICSQKESIVLLNNVSSHLSSFPYPTVVKQFEQNGLADFAGSLLRDKAKASCERKVRAGLMWDTYVNGFNGSRDPLNTLVCVIYQKASLIAIIKAIDQNTHEALSNLIVVRLGGFFLMVMTDIRPSKRYPADWILRIGDHTSTYMWVNLKAGAWERYTTNEPIQPVAPPVNGGSSSKKQKKISPGAFPHKPSLSRLSEVTVSGMHILAYAWNRVEYLLAGVGITKPAGVCMGQLSAFHIHVRPFVTPPSWAKSSTNRSVDEVPEVDNGISRCMNWCEDVVAFAQTFTRIPAKKSVVVASGGPSGGGVSKKCAVVEASLDSRGVSNDAYATCITALLSDLVEKVSQDAVSRHVDTLGAVQGGRKIESVDMKGSEKTGKYSVRWGVVGSKDTTDMYGASDASFAEATHAFPDE